MLCTIPSCAIKNNVEKMRKNCLYVPNSCWVVRRTTKRGMAKERMNPAPLPNISVMLCLVSEICLFIISLKEQKEREEVARYEVELDKRVDRFGCPSCISSIIQVENSIL